MLDLIRALTDGRDQDGASAVEYGLLIAGIAALIVAIVFLFGGAVKGSFSSTCQGLSDNLAAHGGAATTC